MGVYCMADGEKQGLATALADAMDGSTLPPAGAEQLGLLDDDGDLARAASPFDQALERMAEGFGQARRGRGRPPGAKNRRTEDWQRLVLSTHRSPLLVLADFYSMPVEELATRLSCSRLDAAKLQLTAARELAPYLHQKLPLAVDVQRKDVVQLVIETGEAMASQAQLGDALSVFAARVIDVSEIEEKQALGGEGPGKSDNAKSDGDAESRGNAGEPGSHTADLGSAREAAP